MISNNPRVRSSSGLAAAALILVGIGFAAGAVTAIVYQVAEQPQLECVQIERRDPPIGL